MALLVESKTHLIACVHRDVVIINRADRNVNKITLPVQVKSDNGKSGGGRNNEDGDDSDGEEKNAAQSTSNHIHLAVLSPCGTLLAATTHGDKALHILRITNDTAAVVALREVTRTASAMRFTPDSKLLLLADKTGGCYQINFQEDAEEPNKWILGHLSIVLDVLWTPNQDFIITSDRDEKVRVTRFPDAHIIESYCLGHKEYVSAIELLPSDGKTVISVSGDKTVRLWKYLTGEQLTSHKLTAPAYELAVSESDHLAVSILSTPPSIVLLKVTHDESKPKLIAMGSHQLEEGTKSIASLLYTQNGEVLVSAVNANHEVVVHTISLDAQNQCVPVTNALSDTLVKQLVGYKIEHIDDISILFKKRVDNLKDYHERKRRRIEDKQQGN